MPLDEADKKFLGEAIAAALKTNNETQATEIGKLVDARLKPIADDVGALKAKPDPKPEPKPDPDPKPKPKAGEPDPEVEALKKRLDDAEKATLAEKAAIAKEREDNARKELRASAQAALVEAGVPAAQARAAMLVLEADGLITTTKDGKHGFKAKDKYGTEVVLEGKAGAESWLATDAGKAFLPPSGAQGDGSGAGSRQNGKPSSAPRDAKGQVDWGTLGRRAMANVELGSGSPEDA